MTKCLSYFGKVKIGISHTTFFGSTYDLSIIAGNQIQYPQLKINPKHNRYEALMNKRKTVG